jgi:8-oxo-dGTP diphosphatase
LLIADCCFLLFTFYFIYMVRVWQFIKTVMGIIFRHPVTGVTLIPILADGTIVLIRRRDTGQWGLPGGMVDWGEDILNTAKRELSEETGLDLVSLRRLVGVYSSFNRDPRIHSISVLIEVSAEGNFGVKDTLEISDVQAFTVETLPLGNLSHDHDRQLQDYLKGATVIA